MLKGKVVSVVFIFLIVLIMLFIYFDHNTGMLVIPNYNIIA